MQQADGIKTAMAEVADGRPREDLPPRPGRAFVEAVAARGFGACVEYGQTITHSLASSRRKPRHPARDLFKVVNLSLTPQQYYWHESPAQPGDPEVNQADVRRELAYHFHKSPVPELLPTIAWVHVPLGLPDDAEAFESFLNHRLIIRLGTAENHTLVRGEAGLLNIPGIERMTSPGPFGSTILGACNAVEQKGCTVDGLIINPADYYTFLARGRLMQDVEDNGVLIVRTRLVDPGTAIVGDFGHGAQLFDAGRSVIRFAEPPPGTLAEPGIALMAEIYERVVVNLPTHFHVVSL
jgi:hypothetical protein